MNNRLRPNAGWAGVCSAAAMVAFSAGGPGDVRAEPMQVISNDRSSPPVPQSGKSADAARATLKRLTAPPGFTVELYTVVPGARMLALAPGSDQGQLIPPAEESANHSFRTCRVGPDGKLYVTIGQPYNVQPARKVALYRQLGIGGIVRMNLDGSGREVYATGLRNSVGQGFNPQDGTLWFTDNQTDRLGDDVPPGELNRATKPGQDFGYPNWNGHYKVAGSAVAPDLKDLPEPVGAVFPQVEFPAHQAQLGMVFYSGTMFPATYRGGIFVAARGSWNRTVPSGAEVQFLPLTAPEVAGAMRVFLEGYKDAHGAYHGRPVDVAVMKDGSLLVSDDYQGAVYRVRYRAS